MKAPTLSQRQIEYVEKKANDLILGIDWANYEYKVSRKTTSPTSLVAEIKFWFTPTTIYTKEINIPNIKKEIIGKCKLCGNKYKKTMNRQKYCKDCYCGHKKLKTKKICIVCGEEYMGTKQRKICDNKECKRIRRNGVNVKHMRSYFQKRREENK